MAKVHILEYIPRKIPSPSKSEVLKAPFYLLHPTNGFLADVLDDSGLAL